MEDIKPTRVNAQTDGLVEQASSCTYLTWRIRVQTVRGRVQGVEGGEVAERGFSKFKEKTKCDCAK